MTLRVRLAVAMALVAVLTAAAVAITAPAIVGRGFAAIEGSTTSPGGGRGPGQGQGLGPGGGLHAQQIQQETTNTIIVVAAVAAGLASLLGLLIATRMTRPLGRLEDAAAAVARGRLDTRSGLDQRADEIGSLARSFDSMAADLQATEIARRRFFQDAAHELKTPLAVIDATTSAVIDGVYAHEDRHLETVRDQARLLERIVDDLRLVSLADAGVLPLQLEPVDVVGAMRIVARDVQARAAAAGVAVEVPDEVADGPPRTVQADADRLRQILAALTDNAIRHTPAGGRVRLSAISAGAARTRILVVDTGPGIDAEDLPHVFERFYQADAARDRSTGTSGLGLSIVRALVEAHGGTVSAGNEPGGGARFEVDLPSA
jgi:two-component system sensor histidine kinase BaeS